MSAECFKINVHISLIFAYGNENIIIVKVKVPNECILNFTPFLF